MVDLDQISDPDSYRDSGKKKENMITILKKQNKLLLVAAIFFASCKVMLVGAYDQVTDQGIQKMQGEISTLLVKLDRNLLSGAVADNEYAKHKPTYESLAGQVSSLKIRCNALPKYGIVGEQLTLLEDNLKNLEALHKLGFKTTGEIATIRSGFDVQFTAMIKLQNGLKREK